MGQTFDDAERETIRRTVSAEIARAHLNEVKFSQRGTAKIAQQKLPGRTYGSIYAEVRRLTSAGQWWKDVPIGHQLI